MDSLKLADHAKYIEIPLGFSQLASRIHSKVLQLQPEILVKIFIKADVSATIVVARFCVFFGRPMQTPIWPVSKVIKWIEWEY